MPRYRIVPERSHVWIDARSNLHPIHSSTDGIEGFVELDVAPGGGVDLATKPNARLTLPVRRLSSGNSITDRELQRRIDAQRYPTIDGVLDTMDANGHDRTYIVGGDVTFRGVARRYEQEMVIDTTDGDTIQLSGASRFDIRDFGMQPPRFLMLRVEPEVDVRVEILAEREG